MAIVLLTSSVSLLTQGSAGQGIAEQARMIRHERTLPSGRTKLVQFVNSANGKAEYTAAVDPRDRVYLVSTGEEGLYEMGVEPYQPKPRPRWTRWRGS